MVSSLSSCVVQPASKHDEQWYVSRKSLVRELSGDGNCKPVVHGRRPRMDKSSLYMKLENYISQAKSEWHTVCGYVKVLHQKQRMRRGKGRPSVEMATTTCIDDICQHIPFGWTEQRSACDHEVVSC